MLVNAFYVDARKYFNLPTNDINKPVVNAGDVIGIQ